MICYAAIDGRAGTILLGRQTDEDFRGYWPQHSDEPAGAYLDEVRLVTGYSYDQPRATGTVEDADRSRAERSERAALYRRWLNENENELSEDDATYSELCELERPVAMWHRPRNQVRPVDQ
ncbi:hypothetical protein ACWDOP_11735 [Nocardia sp. NPDC003693]